MPSNGCIAGRSGPALAWVFGFGKGSALAADAKLDTCIRTGNWARSRVVCLGEDIFYILGWDKEGCHSRHPSRVPKL